jgi:transposase
MSDSKIQKVNVKDNEETNERYDHYVAIDWSKRVMAIARLTQGQKAPAVVERSADIRELRGYLDILHGTKIITIEETSCAHWLYLELRAHVDKIIVCDPYRNRLLSDGPKTDKIDAAKLCVLLRSGLLKEVFHRDDQLYQLRCLVSAYQDIVQAGVRSMNQKTALLMAREISTRCSEGTPMSFALMHLENSIALYEKTKAEYQKQFATLCRNNALLQAQTKLPGIGVIGAVKIVTTVVDARRFPRDAHYLSYCGLVKLVKESGQRSYGTRSPRFNRTLKSVYKTAAVVAISGNNPMREYYDYLLKRGTAEHNARHAVARQIAKVSYGMMKHGTEYQPERKRSYAITE